MQQQWIYEHITISMVRQKRFLEEVTLEPEYRVKASYANIR